MDSDITTSPMSTSSSSTTRSVHVSSLLMSVCRLIRIVMPEGLSGTDGSVRKSPPLRESEKNQMDI